jgi:HSP20 family protein
MFNMVPFKNSGMVRRGNPWNIDSIFENFFNDSMFQTFFPNNGLMKVDIKENDREFVIEADIPGAKKDEINLEIDENKLTISVNHNEEIKEEEENYIRRERRNSSMARTFAIDNIVADKAKAKFENGVLTITLPKREPHIRRNKRIAIE